MVGAALPLLGSTPRFGSQSFQGLTEAWPLSGLVGAPGCGVWHRMGREGTEGPQISTLGSQARDTETGLVGKCF